MAKIPAVHLHLYPTFSVVLLPLALLACAPTRPETVQICRGADCSNESVHAETFHPGAAATQSAGVTDDGYRGEDLDSLENGAANGDVSAAYKLGLVYQLGLAGTAKDPARAAALFRQAADAGHGSARYRLAQLYFEGEGVSRDPQRGLQLLLAAAEQGNADAAQNVAALYEEGRYLQRDRREAARWFEIAANGGVTSAQTNLGMKYLSGDGVPQNGFDGINWLRRAAESGDVKAQVTLGRLYLSGYDTVGQDIGEADRWITAAAGQGDAEAKKLKAEVQEAKDSRGDYDDRYWLGYPFDWPYYYQYAYVGIYWRPWPYFHG